MNERDNVAKRLSGNLYKALKTKGVTRRFIATKLNVSEAAVGRYVMGTSIPRLDHFFMMADALDMSCDDLLYGESESFIRGRRAAQAELKPIMELLHDKVYEQGRRDGRIDFLKKIRECAKHLGTDDIELLIRYVETKEQENG